MEVAQLSIFRPQAYRTSRSASCEKNYLCTFLNEAGERVDVFEGMLGETFFVIHRRDGSVVRDMEMPRRAA